MKRHILEKLFVLVLVVFISGVSFSQTAPLLKQREQINSLSLDVAKEIASACEKKAEELGLQVGIVVLDQGGNLKLAYLMGNQSKITLDWSKAKALTAYEFSKATNRGEFKVWNIGGETLILGASGGFPLKVKDRVLGAVGVSGTKTDADDIIARAGLEKFGELVSP